MLAAAGCFSGRAMARKLERIGIQLYTVRTLLEKDFEGTLRQVAAIGFQEVEFAGLYGTPPKTVRDLLKRFNLDAPSAHYDLKHIKNSWSKSMDEAREIGVRHLICAWLRPEERESLADYKTTVALLNQAGEACHKAGLSFGYHNHDFEFAPIEGKIPYRMLLEETDPSRVKMELDLYWITKGNQDAMEYFAQYPGRFLFVHVKDMDATPKRSFTDVGRGIIDFKKLLARASEVGVRHFFVEHDEPPSPLETARLGYQYLKGLEL